MNHDYAHCSKFTNKCPKNCFRAQLARDLEKNKYSLYLGMPISYMDMTFLDNCPFGGKENDEKRMG